MAAGLLTIPRKLCPSEGAGTCCPIVYACISVAQPTQGQHVSTRSGTIIEIKNSNLRRVLVLGEELHYRVSASLLLQLEDSNNVREAAIIHGAMA
jgi:hypothetical protein